LLKHNEEYLKSSKEWTDSADIKEIFEPEYQKRKTMLNSDVSSRFSVMDEGVKFKRGHTATSKGFKSRNSGVSSDKSSESINKS
jgi:hypothetical protein